ncbi:MAG: N-methyl-L-tryptophan oxidase [Actinomycetes bacterium]
MRPPTGATHVDVVVVGAGALGSATAWQLARRGVDVALLEQFAFGHARGASHDTSRILRRSYHTPAYVRLADEAYADWALLEREAAEPLVTTVGGLDLFPPGAAIPAVDYVTSMAASGVPFEELSVDDIAARWPDLSPAEGTIGLHQADTSIVPAGRTTATLQRLARSRGARLVDETPVTGIVDHGPVGVEVRTGATSYVCSRVVLAADAWTNQLLAHLGTSLPLTVTREQVTYFAPATPAAFSAARLPVWIWMDDPSFYGFPTYAEGGNAALVKAAEDCGGQVTTAESRSFETDPAALERLAGFVAGLLPGVGAPQRTVTCLYTLTPDRDFVVGALPAHENVVVGLGAGHGFKVAPTFGRVLADLVTDGATSSDIAAFAVDRPALVDADHPVSWLV